MLRIGHAILHVFDFESGSTFFSERELDLDNRQTRSYVTRRLRRIRSSAESKHGTFAPESNFASGLKEYLAGQVPFVDFSVQIAQWFWEELRRAEDLEQCDLLVADFTDTGEMRASENTDEDKVSDAYESEGTRLFAVVLLPRKQAFIYEVDENGNEIARQDATLPNPTQKVDTYVLIDAAQSDAAAAQAQLDPIGQEVSDLSAQLSDTVGQIDDVSAQIDQTQADIDAKQTDIEAKQEDIDSTQKEIEQKQEVLGQRMSAAFKSGNASTIDLLLSSASFEELTSNFYYLDKVSEQDNSMIEEVKSLKADLEIQKAQLEDDKATLESKQADLTSQKDQLNQLKSSQESQLADVQAKQDEAQTLVDQLNSNVQSLIDQRNAELLAAQEEARRMAASRSSSSSSSPVTIVSGASGSQAAVISATYSTGSTGAGYCAAWVSNVFANAGVGSFGGNACDMYWSYCSSSDKSSIKPGMIIAVPTEPYSAAARLYGHIGIYVGNNTVRHCLSGVITTQSLDSWISQFGVSATPRWGWLGGVALA